MTITMVINEYYFLRWQGSRQTNNALGTVIDTCHDHVDRVAAEVNSNWMKLGIGVHIIIVCVKF